MALKFNPFTGTLDYVESGATKEKAEGVPAGGATQTVLMKKSATNYDDEWKLIQNGNIELAANIEEAKLSLPGVVKTTGNQLSMTGEKQFERLEASVNLSAQGLFQNVPINGVTLSGTVEAWEPGTSSFIPVKPEAGAVLAGIKIPAAGNQSGTIITILNEGSNVLTIADNAVGPVLTNKIRTETGANIELKLKGMVQFIYQGSRWRQLANQMTAGEGLELLADKEVKMKALGVTEGLLGPESVTNGKVKKESLEPNRLEKEKLTSEQIKPEGIKEASYEKESVGFTKLGFFNDDAPIEIPAGKTYEVPSNIQGLWKESISVQGTLNLQGRFDEVYTIEPESVETSQIRNGAVTEAKVGSEIVTLAGVQTITGEKKINKLKTESVTFEGTKELVGLSNLTLSGGTFALSEERLALGTSSASTLKQLKFSGTVEESTAFEEATQDCAYAVIPEGGAAILESAKVGATKHRAVFLVNVSTTETLTVVHEGKGLAANRFHFASGENVKLEPGQTIALWYTEGEAAGTLARWRDLNGASFGLRSFTNGIPTEIAAGKTYEVPATIQDLWKDNVSVQGTLNVQGRFDEVGMTEGSPWFLPTIVTETQEIPVPAETWFRFSKVNGRVNVQGELIGTT